MIHCSDQVGFDLGWLLYSELAVLAPYTTDDSQLLCLISQISGFPLRACRQINPELDFRTKWPPAQTLIPVLQVILRQTSIMHMRAFLPIQVAQSTCRRLCTHSHEHQASVRTCWHVLINSYERVGLVYSKLLITYPTKGALRTPPLHLSKKLMRSNEFKAGIFFAVSALNFLKFWIADFSSK